jgi:crossover junction endodeoxyribonuclease RusA
MRATLPCPPSVNAYKHYSCSVDKEHPLDVVLTKATRRFKHDAGWQAKAQGVRMHDGEVRVRIDVYRHLDGKGKRRPLDSDNVLKVLFDSLEGIAWENDRQIRGHSLEMHDIPHGQPDRVEIEIEEL